MSRQRRRDTGPELALRRALHRRGLRFRVNVLLPIDGVRRTADLFFSKPKVAVMVDSCFWHACPTHGSLPRSNATWWQAKLAANVLRDADTDRRLKEAGWAVIRVWEHEAVEAAADRIELAVVSLPARGRPPQAAAPQGRT
jgi:DNA mismatch endonuclease, patch repair protein